MTYPKELPHYYHQPPDDDRAMSIAGFVFGVFTLFAWLLPVCDVPLAIIALGLSLLLIFTYGVDAGLTPYVLQWMKWK